ncbi:hypothetical protein [Cryobacterium psychrophilum]|uniref:Uncharacterized protein n=1 Tax=Cryobacterium psychrophilum TaxID=41988 RepID=A0A4Y8KIV7_9MICO|nr:hypothetical protein [Cryobacterium psychrophilum]TDW30843.1 hypothetical protein EDD25_2620 [Cryobacterium psychrophilum]TFD75767.1 hypothetical protein E3T53_14910 [Cryobacterium psychrophilum]
MCIRTARHQVWVTVAAAPGPRAPTSSLTRSRAPAPKTSSGIISQSTFDYFQPPDKLVSALSLVLGSAPTESTWGEDDKHRGITHAWGDFALLNYDPVVGGEKLNCPNSSFSVAADAVNGVRISTVDGIAVGDNAAEIAARYPDTSWRSAPGGEPAGEPVELHIGVGHVSLPPCEAARGNSDRTYSVRLDAPDPLGPITEFWVPSADWGA